MSSDHLPDERFDGELRTWLERREPPRSADTVAEAVIAKVAVSNQGRRPSFLLSLATAVGAAIFAAMILGTGLLTERAGPHVGAQRSPSAYPGTAPRVPPGGQIIQIGQTASAPLAALVTDGDVVWAVGTRSNIMGTPDMSRIDPATNEVTAVVHNVMAAAFHGSDLWALVGIDDDICCKTGLLRQIDPTTGAVLRTIGGVDGFGLAIAGDTAWVADGGSLTQVDLVSGEPAATIELAQFVWPEHLVATDDAVWVIGEGGLVKVDITQQPAGVSVVLPDEGAAVTVGGGSVWAILRSGDELVQIDPDSGAVVETWTLTGEASTRWGTLAFAHDRVWISVAGGIMRYDPAGRAFSDVIPLPWGFYWGIVARDGELWVSVMDESKVVRFPIPLD